MAAAKIDTPALRTRRSDIPLLADRVLQEEAALGHRCRLSADAMGALMEHGWPGNVRELKNVLKRAAAFGNAILEPEDLQLGDSWLGGGDDFVAIGGQTLRAAREGDPAARGAAQRRQPARGVGGAGMPRSTLNDKLRRYRIDAKELRRPPAKRRA